MSNSRILLLLLYEYSSTYIAFHHHHNVTSQQTVTVEILTVIRICCVCICWHGRSLQSFHLTNIYHFFSVSLSSKQTLVCVLKINCSPGLVLFFSFSFSLNYFQLSIVFVVANTSFTISLDINCFQSIKSLAVQEIYIRLICSCGVGQSRLYVQMSQAKGDTTVLIQTHTCTDEGHRAMQCRYTQQEKKKNHNRTTTELKVICLCIIIVANSAVQINVQA